MIIIYDDPCDDPIYDEPIKNPMEALLDTVKAAMQQNLKHRSGVRISEVTHDMLFNKLHSEVVELSEALQKGDKSSALFEMGDIMNILFHIIALEGWSLKNVEGAGIIKMAQRFSK